MDGSGQEHTWTERPDIINRFGWAVVNKLPKSAPPQPAEQPGDVCTTSGTSRTPAIHDASRISPSGSAASTYGLSNVPTASNKAMGPGTPPKLIPSNPSRVENSGYPVVVDDTRATVVRHEPSVKNSISSSRISSSSTDRRSIAYRTRPQSIPYRQPTPPGRPGSHPCPQSDRTAASHHSPPR